MVGERPAILFVHGSNEWYGSDYVLYEIVRSLRDTEFDAIVLVPSDVTSELPEAQRLSGRLRELGTTVHALPLTVLRRRYSNPWGVIRLAAGSRASLRNAIASLDGRAVALVHSHTATVLTGRAAARALGVPHVWHVSEILERPALLRRWLSRTVVKSSDRVIAVSHAVRTHILATQPGAEAVIDVIHNGIDVQRFGGQRPPPKRAGDDTLVVGMIGRVGTWKGQELLLAAAQRVCRACPQARFVLAGGVLDGNVSALEELRCLAASYGIAHRVDVQEYCTNTPELLSNFDVFVQPSLRPDPLPTTILEAMASEKPVVATAHGGAPEMVVDGVTGLLTPPGDSDAMASAILILLRDRQMRISMGRAGRERAVSEFAPAAFNAAYLRTYRELVGIPR